MPGVTTEEATQQASQAPRTVQATATVRVRRSTLRIVMEYGEPPGEVLVTARIAGVMAAKRCSELIPLCHHQLVGGTEIEFATRDSPPGLVITASVSCAGKIGADMEAMTAAAIAALAVYDMVKLIDKEAVVTDLRVLPPPCSTEPRPDATASLRHE